LLISIGFVRDGILRGRAKSGPVSKSSELKTTSLRIISTPSPVAAPALLETNAPIESSSSLREKADFFRLGPPPSGVIYIFGNTGAVAVIDFTRIAKALALPTIPGEKAPKIATVRDAVAAVAVAHNLAFVFDSTAMTRSDSPVFPYSEATPDITDLVLQSMGSLSNQIRNDKPLDLPDHAVDPSRSETNSNQKGPLWDSSIPNPKYTTRR